MGTRLQCALPWAVAALLVAAILATAWRSLEPVRVCGGSMHPALHQGDLVLVERGEPAQVGDIALVKEPGHLAVLHRVVARSMREIRTRGDANPIADLQGYERSSVAGRVALVIPMGRWAERWR